MRGAEPPDGDRFCSPPKIHRRRASGRRHLVSIITIIVALPMTNHAKGRKATMASRRPNQPGETRRSAERPTKGNNNKSPKMPQTMGPLIKRNRRRPGRMLVAPNA